MSRYIVKPNLEVEPVEIRPFASTMPIGTLFKEDKTDKYPWFLYVTALEQFPNGDTAPFWDPVRPDSLTKEQQLLLMLL